MVEQNTDDSRPTKRPRSAEEESEAQVVYTSQNAALWFADGNIILVSADSKGFRVHQSVLALHSDFFNDMFTLARSHNPKDAAECTRLALTDSAEDLESLIEQFYKRTFYPGICTHFTRLASLLRLGTKYLCRELRADVIKHLSLIYTPQTKNWSLPVRLPRFPKLVHSSEKHSHSLAAIQMARENDIPDILPIAYYYACCIPEPLSFELPRQMLSTTEECILLRGRAQLLQAVYEEAWGWFSSQPEEVDEEDRTCKGGCCQATRFDIVRQFALNMDTALRLFLAPRRPHEQYSPRAQNQPAKAGKVCSDCWDSWEDMENGGYRLVWEDMPSYFGLSPWPDSS